LPISDCRLALADLLRDLIRERGPLTVAAFMEIALYDRDAGYYARAAQRSGRAGDFFTSVDVGPLFGELLETQIAEMAGILSDQSPNAQAQSPLVASPAADVPGPPALAPRAAAACGTRARQPRWGGVARDSDPAFDLVEAGAGNGRLSADILRAARRRDRRLYERTRLHLSDASASARAAQHSTLSGSDVADRLVSSGESLPSSFEGVLVANELLDALPVHQVVMRAAGLREVYVDARNGRLVTREGPLSTPALASFLDRLEVVLAPGWCVEINLRALDWIRDVAARLRRGFVILIDYGHEARELYSPSHASGTLTTFARHTMAGPESSPDTPSWLAQPGDRDITAHVDFTSVRETAEAEGLTTLGFLDQTYFLLALANLENPENPEDPKNTKNREHLEYLAHPENLRQRLALKTLLMPGGLGSTHKVMILSKGVGTPALLGCSYKMRVT
jgi:SAM-dependent MidA family methyltransferase